MAQMPVQIEVERVMNLVRGFGWEKVEEMIDEKSIYLKIKKNMAIERPGIPE